MAVVGPLAGSDTVTDYLGGFYLNPHRSQYAPDSSTRTRRAGCGPTSAANGANAATGGKVSLSGAQVHALIPQDQETNPTTPGWSIVDVDRAMAKLGVGFESRDGTGWAGVVAAWNAGLYVWLAGDSDQFGDATCSGDYDGPHAVGVGPETRVVGGLRQRWLDDPICPGGRWEYEWVLHRYAAKFSATIVFGVFTSPVPKAPAAAPVTVTLRGGGTRLSPRQIKRISVPRGKRAIVRPIPSSAGNRHVPEPRSSLGNGQYFDARQVTKTGQELAGSRKWYGDRTGTRWLHVSAF